LCIDCIVLWRVDVDDDDWRYNTNMKSHQALQYSAAAFDLIWFDLIWFDLIWFGNNTNNTNTAAINIIYHPVFLFVCLFVLLK